MKSHTGERPFPSTECEEAFVRKYNLDYHMKKVHTGERPYKCMTCSKSYILEVDLKRHMYVHSGQKPFRCSKCNGEFSSQRCLNDHIKRMHRAQSRFHCNICDQAFSSDMDFQFHIMTHTGEKPKKSMVFAWRNSILQPDTNRTNRPFECTKCGKSN